MGVTCLLQLQGLCKTDPESYADEFQLRLRHFRSLLAIFAAAPAADYKEFADLVAFLAQVHASYPRDLVSLPTELAALLDAHAPQLAPPLRRSLVQALILMHNRGSIETTFLVPLFFRLFRCADKPLRQLLYRHMVSDIKSANRKRAAEQLNRGVHSLLHAVLAEPHEGAAKRAVALASELYRRGIWTGAPTVNLLAAAVQHSAAPVAVAALRFFNGADEAADGEDGGGSDDDPDDPEAANKRRSAEAQGAVGLTREQVYSAYSKGTNSSKKKKQAKLKREIAKVRKAAKRAEATNGTGRFAALHLLHDPQGFAEKLFSRAQSSSGAACPAWETRLLMLQVLTRVVGAHKLILLNLYPFMQRYIQPHARDVTRLLAAAAQAVHEDVPPDALQPLLRSLVDGFVHDRARPEVIAVGLAAVRELVIRQPLVMSEELLTDLTGYKKHKDKGVIAAARALVVLFREIAPKLLARKDRGKKGSIAAGAGRVGAAAAAETNGGNLGAYGASKASTRVAGAELLEQAERDDAEEEEEEGEEGGSDEGGSDGSDGEMGSGSDGEGGESDAEMEEGSDDDEEDGSDGEEEEEEEAEPAAKRLRPAQPPAADSLRTLKKAHAAAAAAAAPPAEPALPVEQQRFLTDEDFARIRAIQADRAVGDAMRRMGAKAAAAEGGATVAAALAAGHGEGSRGAAASDRRVDPDSLLGTHRVHSDKAARLAKVYEGREGRAEFGSAAGRHKKKVGGSSNKEKLKKKALPFAARQAVAKHRASRKKGHKGAHKSNKSGGRR